MQIDVFFWVFEENSSIQTNQSFTWYRIDESFIWIKKTLHFVHSENNITDVSLDKIKDFKFGEIWRIRIELSDNNNIRDEDDIESIKETVYLNISLDFIPINERGYIVTIPKNFLHILFFTVKKTNFRIYMNFARNSQ